MSEYLNQEQSGMANVRKGAEMKPWSAKWIETRPTKMLRQLFDETFGKSLEGRHYWRLWAIRRLELRSELARRGE